MSPHSSFFIMDSTLLEVVYNLNETRGKRVSVGFDSHYNFEPCFFFYKLGVARIKITDMEWMTLVALHGEVETFFTQEAFVHQVLEVSTNIKLSLVESHGKRLICLDYTVNKFVNKFWMTDKQWNMLLKLRTCLELVFMRYKACAQELRSLFEALAYRLNLECGNEMRRTGGDMNLLQQGMRNIDMGSLTYNSDTGLDVQRALQELQIYCGPQFREFIKYNSIQ